MGAKSTHPSNPPTTPEPELQRVVVGKNERAAQFLGDDELSIILVHVAEFLELSSLSRLQRTCKLALLVLGAEDVWHGMFERLGGGIDVLIPGTSERISQTITPKPWKTRVRKLMEEVPRLAESPPDNVVFCCGVWLLCASLTFGNIVIQSRPDAPGDPVTVEIVWQSNGWWRARLGAKEFVFWSQGNKTPQQTHDTMQKEVFRTTPPSKWIPVPVGTRIGKNKACTIDVKQDVLYVNFHRAIESAKFMTLSRTSTSDVIFVGKRITELPMQFR